MATEKRLIDANALMDKLEDLKSVLYGWEDYNTGVDSAVYKVENAPTVDAVEVVHGRWIDDGGLDEDGNGQYRCSCCGVGEKHNPTVTVSYCWNCGAKMDGDGNG